GGNYMGLAHFGTAATNVGVGNPPGSPTSTVGLDLLPVMNSQGLAVGASGFTSPLGPGTYTFLIGEQVVELDSFPTYEFAVSVVPGPASIVLLGLGVVGILSLQSRTSRYYVGSSISLPSKQRPQNTGTCRP